MVPLFGFILAQVAPGNPPSPEQGVGLLKTIIAGGVPLICAVVAVVAALAAVYQYRANATLEAKYRDDLEARAKQTAADAEKRLTEAKAEAKERAAEVEKLQDKLRAEIKESDVTLAAATRMIEKAADVLGRVERKLDGKA